MFAPIAANAAGVGDTSAAVLYDTNGPIGDVLTDLSGQDDSVTTIALPFPINFFGDKYDALCVSTNGVVVPVPTVADSCSSDYDVDLATFAVDSDQSVIGALLADNDPSETLWVASAPVTALSVATGVATFTTSTPHGYAVGDYVEIEFVPADADFGSWFSGTVTSVVSPTQFTAATGVADTAERAAVGTTGRPYDDTQDDSDADGLADDGFGAVKQVYAGSTTFDGAPAFAVTWYRVPTNDRENSRVLSNTFQIVLIQTPTVDGATVGYDFVAQFNFGTLTDDNDGYDETDPTSGCDSTLPETCRWSVGWARWDAGTDTAEEFELFADAPVSDIVDQGGVSALTNNSLNSTVRGRYTFGMVAGVTISFAVPVLDGNVPVVAAPVPAAPVLAATGSELVPFGGAALVLLLGGITLIALSRRSARS